MTNSDECTPSVNRRAWCGEYYDELRGRATTISSHTIYTAKRNLRPKALEAISQSETTSIKLSNKSRRLYQIDLSVFRDEYRALISTEVYLLAKSEVSQLGELSYTIPTKQKMKPIATFSLSFCMDFKSARIGPVGSVGLLPPTERDRGIGRYCVSLMTKTARTIIPMVDDFTVVAPHLSQNDADTKRNELNRNKFYTNSGFKIVEKNSAEPVMFSSLMETYNKSKVRVVHPKYFMKLLDSLLSERDGRVHDKIDAKIAITDAKTDAMHYKKRSWLWFGVATAAVSSVLFFF